MVIFSTKENTKENRVNYEETVLFDLKGFWGREIF